MSETNSKAPSQQTKKPVQKSTSQRTAAKKTATRTRATAQKATTEPKKTVQKTAPATQHIADQIKVFPSNRVWPD